MGTVLVEGPAGIGKSRTVEEFRTAVHEPPDVEVLVGGCVEVGSDVLPYAPFVDILSDLADREGAAAVRAAGRPSDGRRTGPSPAGRRRRRRPPDVTQASAGRLYSAPLSQHAAHVPRLPWPASPLLVLVREDVHWSDRDDPRPAGTAGAAAARRRNGPRAHRTHRRVRRRSTPRWAALPRPAVGGRSAPTASSSSRSAATSRPGQLSDILGVPPTARLDEVYGRAEGNPFFAEELLALGSDAELPVTVRDLLVARLGALRASESSGAPAGGDRRLPSPATGCSNDHRPVGRRPRQRPGPGDRETVLTTHRRRRQRVPPRPAARGDRRVPAAGRGARVHHGWPRR